MFIVRFSGRSHAFRTYLRRSLGLDFERTSVSSFRVAAGVIEGRDRLARVPPGHHRSIRSNRGLVKGDRVRFRVDRCSDADRENEVLDVMPQLVELDNRKVVIARGLSCYIEIEHIRLSSRSKQHYCDGLESRAAFSPRQ